MDIYSRFKATFQDFRFIPEKSLILSAYSGGRDSTALLRLFLMLREELPLTVHAAYFNHGIRRDAAEEEAWVRESCGTLGVPLQVGHGDIPGLKRKNGGNLEEIASNERYRYLFQTLDSLRQPAFLATAHHLGDQLETFLFRLARGSGPHGLLGIFPHVDERLIRPLHRISPREITDFLEENGFPWYHDPSNDDTDFSRNRIRHHVLPELERINPSLYSSFSRGLSILAEEDRYLQECARKALEELCPLDGVIHRPGLLSLHPALAKRVLRRFIARNRGSLRSIEQHHVETLLNSIAQCRRGVHLPGLDLAVSRDWIVSATGEPQGCSLSVESPDQTVAFPGSDARLSIRFVNELCIDADNLSVTLPAGKLVYPLSVRSPGKSDRYRRANTDYDQEVWEMLRERGIPRVLRPLFPLLQNGDGEAIWCYSCPLAAPFHCPLPAPPGMKLVRIGWSGHPFERFLSRKT